MRETRKGEKGEWKEERKGRETEGEGEIEREREKRPPQSCGSLQSRTGPRGWIFPMLPVAD